MITANKNPRLLNINNLLVSSEDAMSVYEIAEESEFVTGSGIGSLFSSTPPVTSDCFE